MAIQTFGLSKRQSHIIKSIQTSSPPRHREYIDVRPFRHQGHPDIKAIQTSRPSRYQEHPDLQTSRPLRAHGHSDIKAIQTSKPSGHQGYPFNVMFFFSRDSRNVIANRPRVRFRFGFLAKSVRFLQKTSNGNNFSADLPTLSTYSRQPES